MAITLIINPGSSSKKFALYNERNLLISAHVERSEDGFEMCTSINGIQQSCELQDKQSFSNCLSSFLDAAKRASCIKECFDINVVVLRVVAPGTFFQQHRIVDEDYIKLLRETQVVAPLHVPHVLAEIENLKKLLPKTKIVAASDSEFHKTIPDFVRRYSLPLAESKKYDIFRFGYHGLSVASVVRRVASLTNKSIQKTIVCHIGSGVSVTAVKDGQSVDTTMGYAPGSGLIMGSRAGDLDAGALLTLMQLQNIKPKDAQVYLQTQGGLRGLAGESDLRLLLERRAKGDIEAEKAIASFVYQIKKVIGSYAAALGGLDAIILTATASERSSILRQLILSELALLGIKIDIEKNEFFIGREGLISKKDSEVAVFVIKTDEADEMLRVSEMF
jgi:acetate kinase